MREFDGADIEALSQEIVQWREIEKPLLGEILIEFGAVEPEHLTEALAAQHALGPDGHKRLGEMLLSTRRITERQLASALAEQFGVPFVDLDTVTPDADAIELIGEALAYQHTAMPLRIEDGRVFIALSDPLDTDAIDALTRKVGRTGMLMAAESDIIGMLDRHFSALTETDVHVQAFELTTDLSEDSGPERAEVDDNAPVVQVVNRIVVQGVRNRASDIHIEPMKDRVRVRYRIDGALSQALELPSKMAPALASRIKVLSELNIVERRRPQDGQFSTSVDGRPIDIRTSLVGTIHGEKIVMRLLDKTKSLIGLDELGMPDTLIPTYVKIVKRPLGMLLCTGPTGSGKTTTLYATLMELRDDTRNVVTIEDPVEYQFDGINQMQVNEAAGFGFADGLKGTLRQDPDVILVGEIRDIETARIAMQAALTGHFVLSSLHSVDSVAAVHRFIDMGIEPFLVASAINGVMGQRLLRKICSSCRVDREPTPDQVRLVQAQVGRVPAVWQEGAGCNLCAGTGYRGRVGVYELLEITDEVRDLIVERATHHEIRSVAIAGGMRTMQDEAFRLVADGVTTVEEVVRSVYAPDMQESGGPAAPLALERGPHALPGAKEIDRTGPDALPDAAPSLPRDAGPIEGQASAPESAGGEARPDIPMSNGSAQGASANPTKQDGPDEKVGPDSATKSDGPTKSGSPTAGAGPANENNPGAKTEKAPATDKAAAADKPTDRPLSVSKASRPSDPDTNPKSSPMKPRTSTSTKAPR